MSVRRTAQPEFSRLGHDLDLDREIVLDSDGRRLSEADAEAIAEDALRRAGRRPLAGTQSGQKSPQLSIRLSPSIRSALHAKAHREGKRVSDIAREAIEAYVQS